MDNFPVGWSWKTNKDEEYFLANFFIYRRYMDSVIAYYVTLLHAN
jgi:hypothetical protein